MSFAESNFVLGTYRNVQNKEHPILNPILDSVFTRIRLAEVSRTVSMWPRILTSGMTMCCVTSSISSKLRRLKLSPVIILP